MSTKKKKPKKAEKPRVPAAKKASARTAASRERAVPVSKKPIATKKATIGAAQKTASAAHTVLLVDDFPDAREMYLEYLAFAGYRTAEAANGLEAIERALELSPSVILMDLAMPVMDGWEATRRLKADPRTRRIPVIAVTGHALEGDAERARLAGCDGVLSKPCLPQDLLDEVRRAIGAGIKS